MKIDYTCLVLVAQVALVCSACEDPGSAASVSTAVDESEPPPIAQVTGEVTSEVTEPTLLSRLYTERVSGDTNEHWYCRSSLTETPVAYLFPRDAVDTGIYVAIHPGQGFEASYSHVMLDDQTVVLDYTAQSVQETLGDIEFDGADSWSGQSSTDDSLVCERQRVSVPIF